MDSSDRVEKPVPGKADYEEIVIKKPLVYGTWVFSIGGFLPWQHSPIQFVISTGNIGLLVALQLWDAYDVRNNFMLLIGNLLMTALIFIILYTNILIKTKKGLTKMMDDMMNDIQTGSLFQTNEEKQLYQDYNTIYVKFDKYIVLYGFLVGLLFYLRPAVYLAFTTRTGEDNITRPYELPYRVHLFTDYRYNGKVYFAVYVYESIVPFVGLYHTAAASVVTTFTLHTCGKLSILSHRIRISLTKNPSQFREKIKSIVTEHIKMITSASHLNDTFSHLLMVEYLSCTFRFSLAMYMLLTVLKKNVTFVVVLTLYCAIILIWLYLYSYIGEQLSQVSQEVGEAFYDTNWTKIESQERMLLLPCQINGQKPIYLTAMGVYSYSLFGFTELVKVSMAFVSMLRTRGD